MRVAVYLPLLLPLLVALAAPRVAARLAPPAAVRGLVTAATVAAATSTWSLGLLTLTLLDDLPPLAALGNDPTLDLPKPVFDPVALAAACALAWGAVRLATDLRRRRITVRALRAAGRPVGGLVIADWTTPLAVAVPGRMRTGHLLVTTGMLRTLEPDERRVVFAHERAHLVHDHHRWVGLVAAAAAVNPLLRPVREAVAYLVERWADEDAAAAVEDRWLVARAVGRAALATVEPVALTALGVHGSAVLRRVRALTQPCPEDDRRALLGVAFVATLCLTAAVASTVGFIDVARAWLG